MAATSYLKTAAFLKAERRTGSFIGNLSGNKGQKT